MRSRMRSVQGKGVLARVKVRFQITLRRHPLRLTVLRQVKACGHIIGVIECLKSGLSRNHGLCE